MFLFLLIEPVYTGNRYLINCCYNYDSRTLLKKKTRIHNLILYEPEPKKHFFFKRKRKKLKLEFLVFELKYCIPLN